MEYKVTYLGSDPSYDYVDDDTESVMADSVPEAILAFNAMMGSVVGDCGEAERYRVGDTIYEVDSVEHTTTIWTHVVGA